MNENKIHEGVSKDASPFFNFTFRYIIDAVSLKNKKISTFDDFVDRIYPIEVEIKEIAIIRPYACGLIFQ